MRTTRCGRTAGKAAAYLRRNANALRPVLAFLSVLLALAAPVWVSGQTSEPSEYSVKAAFLFHFAQFVEWPEGTLQEGHAPLVYCTIGDDPFQGALEQSLKGKTVGLHSVQIRHLRAAKDAQGCHVVYLGSSLKKRIPAELASLKGSPVLTVGETEQFVKDDGMIGFCMEENRIHFDINLEAAEKANLRISARLLTLARNVVGRPKRD